MFKREISASGWKAMTFSNANVNGPTNVQSTPRSMVPEPGGLSCRRTVRICSCTPPGRLFRLTGALAGENPAGPNPGQSFFDRCTECFSLNLPAVSSEACRKFAVSCRRLNVGNPAGELPNSPAWFQGLRFCQYLRGNSKGGVHGWHAPATSSSSSSSVTSWTWTSRCAKRLLVVLDEFRCTIAEYADAADMVGPWFAHVASGSDGWRRP